MTHTFYIVRHGNTFNPADVVTRVGGKTDLDLSVAGQDQGRALAKHFKDTHFDRCLCSPLNRTRQTAELLLGNRTDAPQIQFAEFLRELDYGPDENQPESIVQARIGEEALHLWETEAVLPQGWVLDIPALRTAWRNLFDTAKVDGHTLLITSNGIARFALLELGLANKAYTLKLRTGAYGRLERDEIGMTQVKAWNIQPEPAA